jgi:hypothetical protein
MPQAAKNPDVFQFTLWPWHVGLPKNGTYYYRVRCSKYLLTRTNRTAAEQFWFGVREMLCCLDDRDSISQAGSVGRRLSSNVHQSNRKDAPAPLRLLCSVPLRPCRDMLPPQLMSWSCLLLALAGGTLAVITHHAQHNAKGHLQSSSHRLLFFSLLYITNNTGNRLQLAASVGHFQYGLISETNNIFLPEQTHH